MSAAAFTPRASATARSAASVDTASNVGQRGERGVERREMLGHPVGAQMLRRPPPRRTRSRRRRRTRPCVDEIVEPLRARLQQLEHGEEPRVAIAEVGRRPTARPPRATASRRRASSSGASRTMCCWLNQSSFSGLNTALPPLMPSSANAADQLVAREQLLIAAPGDQPSSARKFTIASGR